jgi:hypothetical protein
VTKYTIQCGGLELTTQQELAVWRSIIQGLGEKYEAKAMDEDSAKNLCIEVAKQILRRAGFPFPDCLNKPLWISTRE